MQPGVFELIVCARLGISENSAETRFQRAPFHVEHCFFRTTFLARPAFTYPGQQGDYAAPPPGVSGQLAPALLPPPLYRPSAARDSPLWAEEGLLAPHDLCVHKGA